MPVGTLVSEEAKRFGRHTTVVVITPSTSEDWVGSLQFISERGVKVAAILIEARHLRRRGQARCMVFGALAAADVYTYMVKKSDDLITSLALGVESRRTCAPEANAMRQASWEEMWKGRETPDTEAKRHGRA